MKYKVLALAVLATIIYSCASKSSVPTVATPKEEVKAAPAPATTYAAQAPSPAARNLPK